MADVSVSQQQQQQQQQAKRKRGRPRKDSNLCREGKTHHQLLDNNSSSVDMGGSVVYGVIEGSFDAGYLISVTIGNEPTPFRGVVFHPKKIVPISPANDVAPQAKMYDRRRVAVSDDDVCKDQVDRASGKSLRMVEEDEVMQAFEVSTSGASGSSNLQLHHKTMTFEIQQDHTITEHATPSSFLHNSPPSPTIELLHQTPTPANTHQPMYYNQLTGTDVSFHQNLFTHPNPKSLSEAQFHPTSQSLKLGLDGPEPQSETSYGFHQALVAGNPLLLPPDLMMEKPNLEQDSRSGVDNAGLHAKPTSETNYCMGDLDLVLHESHHHQHHTDASETTHTPD